MELLLRLFPERNGAPSKALTPLGLNRLNGLNVLNCLNHSKGLHPNWQFTTLAAFFKRSIEQIPGGLNGSRKFGSGRDFSAR
jgi:hypothetical protein